MAHATQRSKKLRILLVPFFATSHIGPITDLAIRLARPGHVLKIGQRVWNGARSTRYEEREVVSAEAVAQAVARFLEPGGTGEARARELAAKAHAAVAEGGSSFRDLRRLVDDLIEARAAAGETTSPSVPGPGPENEKQMTECREGISQFGAL